MSSRGASAHKPPSPRAEHGLTELWRLPKHRQADRELHRARPGRPCASEGSACVVFERGVLFEVEGPR